MISAHWGECDEGMAKPLTTTLLVDPDDIVILIELLTSRLARPCAIERPYRY